MWDGSLAFFKLRHFMRQIAPIIDTFSQQFAVGVGGKVYYNISARRSEDGSKKHIDRRWTHEKNMYINGTCIGINNAGRLRQAE